MEKSKPNTQEHATTPTWWQWRRLGYAVAVAGTSIATLISWLLPKGADLPLYLPFFPGMFAAAVVGGSGPGALATILGAMATNLIFIAHGGELEFGATPQPVRLGLFLGSGVAISLLGERLRRQSVALRENEARLRHFIDQAPVAISMLDTKMRYLAVSRRWLAVFSLSHSSQQLLGRSHYEVFPEIPERWKQVHRRCLVGAVESANEDLFERADGRRQWMRWEIQPWYAAPGIIGGIVIFTEDITARVEAREALRQSEERFRTMADNIPQLAFMARPDGYFFWCNQRCYEYSGCTPEQLEGWGWQRVVHPRLLPRVLELWRRSLATGASYDFGGKSRLRGADGSYRPFLTRVVPLKDQSGRVVLWFGTSTDITELKEAQEALRQGEERLRLATKATNDVIWDWDIANDRQRWNEAGSVVFGWTEIVQHSVSAAWWVERVHPDDRERVEQVFFTVVNDPVANYWHDEYRFKKADGSYADVMDRGYVLRDTSGKAVRMIGAMLDITERNRTQEARARLAAIVEWSDDAIVSKTLDGTIQTWNAGAERMFGYRAEEVIGRPVTLLIPPERLWEEERVLAQLRRGEPLKNYQTVRLTKDGQRLDVSLTISLVKDSGGRIIGASKIARDIGDLVRAREVLARGKWELERLVEERTAKLHEALAELEHMSYSMIHDMRAPLRAMQCFAQLISAECAECRLPPVSDHLKKIDEASLRLDRLLTDALNYNKVVRENLPLTPVDLDQLLRAIVQTYPNLQPPGAEITIDPGSEWMVLGNESLLTQCFANLLDNAVKFVAPGVHPRIRVWAQPSTIDQQPSTIAYVADNGIGIPKEAQEKIFGMFQRIHHESEYPGTGIGLTICNKAVQRMGGRLGLKSEPGHGTTFWVELPRAIQPQLLQRAA